VLSRLHLVTGDTQTALTMAEGAVANVPGSPDARVALARTLVARGEIDRATTEVAGLMKVFPQAAAVHALDAGVRYQRKDFAGARKSYEKALELAPQSLEALAGLTRLDLAEKKVEDARKRIEARAAADPKSAEVLYLAANVYAAGRDLPKAEETLRRGIQADPTHSLSYTMLAGVLLAQKKLDAARDEFDSMATRDPKNVGAKTMAAMIVHSQNLPEAKRRYAEILKDAPDAGVAANNLAWIYAEEGTRLDEALRLAQTATAQMADNAAAQDTLGWVYYKKEMPERAIEPFEKSVTKEPENPVYHYHLALALQRLGDVRRARESAQRAVKLKPDYTEAQQLLSSLKG
jgi:Tfp pilus assembly protein PilF